MTNIDFKELLSPIISAIKDKYFRAFFRTSSVVRINNSSTTKFIESPFENLVCIIVDLDTTLNGINPVQRKCFELSVLDPGSSYREIGYQLNLAPTTVKQYIWNTRKYLKRKLKLEEIVNDN